ncbi:hypothetical protein F4678DRAFT_454363 [Xylaria arbuscula]|nr:hypothetical protein F4678DRAFT_454363 [Xylaria arbuscula]
MKELVLERDTGPDVLLFGPQVDADTTLLTSVSSLQLSAVANNEKQVQDLISEFSILWARATRIIPNIDIVPVKQHLACLRRVLLNDNTQAAAPKELPNTILAPLTVVTQAREYQSYVDKLPSTRPTVPTDTGVISLGFCIGLLTRYALINATSGQDFSHRLLVAIRLAFLVGAIVDAEGISNSNGPAATFAARWRRDEGRKHLERIIAQFADHAYVSVQFDKCHVTVTSSEHMVADIIKEIQGSGILTTPMQLRGRFHSGRHQNALAALVHLCAEEPMLQFPSGSQVQEAVQHPDVYSMLPEDVLRSILVDKCDWYDVLSATLRNRAGSHGSLSYLRFGSGPCVPPSLAHRLNSFSFLKEKSANHAECYRDANHPPSAPQTIEPREGGTDSTSATASRQKSCDIAIVGMSIKVAGADDLNEFSEVIRAGQSQHQVAPDRVPRGNPRPSAKTAKNQTWYGNFMRDVDSFDHKFFKKSPRECAAMDPQQRLTLQAAYQAVEQSGYFNVNETSKPMPCAVDAPAVLGAKHVGVYIAACATDYADNAACHEAGAFTVMGLLRAPIAGRVSHFFGWTGPSMTLDTACSGAAVAVHLAVRALLAGECTAALCGGVNVLANEVWFQNLAGASFLSPTGQCKPFDDAADGYCRGEGVGFVFLKPMDAAVADGNQIFGRIAGTAVHQNQNTTPLFVPNSLSLSHLFCDVLRQAKLPPSDISIVEAHGTGTPVGDPAEYEAVCNTFGGSHRHTQLALGSVKGLVGHTESASGIVSLIKVLLMMHEAYIPPQASYSTTSHRIRASSADKIDIPTRLQSWSEKHKAALVNNYGASGSNAAVIVTQVPQLPQCNESRPLEGASLPFWISGLDQKAVMSYCARLAIFVEKSSRSGVSLGDICYNLSRQSNRSLSHALFFTSSTVAGLLEQLSPHSALRSTPTKGQRPVILCFGGQASRSVRLDRALYENVPLICHHLNACDAQLKSLGIASIFPDIFCGEPIDDQVRLQTMLFSLQYSFAKSWDNSGVQIEAVVGHSFGEITALCISGALGVRDSLQLVKRRAEIIRDCWGPDRGSMMMVEADECLVDSLLSDVNRNMADSARVSVACFNSPRNYTLAGSTDGISKMCEILSENSTYRLVRSRRLDVTNAFHSELVRPLLPALREILSDIQFLEPRIRFERATETSSMSLNDSFPADHMLQPVFFDHAVKRLAKDYPSAIWLEASSGSSIMPVVRRAAESAYESHFQSVYLTPDASINSLSDITLSLWKEGLRFTFWPHHDHNCTSIYKHLLLPPYQFEKTRHWLEWKSCNEKQNTEEKKKLDRSGGLWSFVGFYGSEQQHARFELHTDSPRFVELVASHSLVHAAPICPATLQYSIATKALLSLQDEIASLKGEDLQPVICDMDNHVPLCLKEGQSAFLDLEAVEHTDNRMWTWKIFTTLSLDRQAPLQDIDSCGRGSVLCVEGRLELHASGVGREFMRYERLVTHEQCVSLLQESEGSQTCDLLQGHSVYRSLAVVVDYGKIYQGVLRVVGRQSECAGIVECPRTAPASESELGWLDDIGALDSFCQVAGVWVNCMMDRGAANNDVFLATGCEVIRHTAAAISMSAETRRYPPGGTWHVWARHNSVSDTTFLTDLFVFDAKTGRMVVMFLGIRYTRIAKAALIRMFSRIGNTLATLRSDLSTLDAGPSIKHSPSQSPHDESFVHRSRNGAVGLAQSPVQVKQQQVTTASDTLRAVIADIVGALVDEVKDDSVLADLGIDSLVSMELTREIEHAFQCKLSMADFLSEAHDFRELLHLVEKFTNTAPEKSSVSNEIVPGRPLSNLAPAYGEPPHRPKFKLQEDILDPESSEISFALVDHPGDDSDNSDTSLGKAKAESTGSTRPLLLPPSHKIIEAFERVKISADRCMREQKVGQTDGRSISASNRLCATLVAEALEHLGCSLRSTTAGQPLTRISHHPKHKQLVHRIYEFLENDFRLIDTQGDGSQLIRTTHAIGAESSDSVVQELIDSQDPWTHAHRLTYHAGKRLPGVLKGTEDGIAALFGSVESRGLVEGLYHDLPFNRLFYEQMRDMIGLLIESLPHNSSVPLRILEVGAGTCGTTEVIALYLAEQGIPVEYTVTDLSPSMVAQARRNFRSRFSFLKFAVHDMEQDPPEGFQNQHVIIASNAVHATSNLPNTLSKLRASLAPGGILLMTEMTEALPFVDLVFGLLESWWLFSDGRKHAIVSAAHWDTCLRSAGFCYVDWTNGVLPEHKIQKVIMAIASDPHSDQIQIERRFDTPTAESGPMNDKHIRNTDDCECYVSRYAAGFMVSSARQEEMSGCGDLNLGDSALLAPKQSAQGIGIIVTGASGSLGSHLVAQLAENPSVSLITILDRSPKSAIPADQRQRNAFVSRKISIPAKSFAKLRFIGVDYAQPSLGLSPAMYRSLVASSTHVIHNGWPMSANRPLRSFEPQFQTMQHLLKLAADMARHQVSLETPPNRVVFQFVSSIGTVGLHQSPSNPRVLEEHVPSQSTLPVGYCEAKWVCERLVERTLGAHPDRFRAMVLRPGQIAGSSVSGAWNSHEHFVHMLRSAQSLRVFPDLKGSLCWLPVDAVAGTVIELALNDSALHSVYHIDNPMSQSWSEMVPVLAEALNIPSSNIKPFAEWSRRVRWSPLTKESGNPALRVLGFLDKFFLHMSCGGIILDTTKTQQVSPTLSAQGPVSADLTRQYIRRWQEEGILD